MKKIEKIGYLICGLLFLFGATVSVDAAGEMQGTGFFQKIKHPENQIGTGEALNLMMNPGQKQKVEVEVTNYKDKEIVVELKLTGARTNGNGGLEYGPNKLPKDKTMKYDLPDLVKIPSEVKVPAKGTATFTLDISMPEADYDGIVTGGVQLIEKGTSIETQDEKGATIQNKVAFLFGVTLRMSETEVKPDFDLNSVKAGLQNYRNAIFLNLSNKQSMIAKDMVLNTEITEKGKSEVLYQKKKTEVSMAPNTVMNFPVSLDGDSMKAGDYTANVILKGYDKEWKWKKNFTITKEEADKFNKQDPYLVQERGLNWKMISLIVGGVLLLIIIIVVILKVTKKKPSQKGSSSKKKSSKTK